MPCCAHTINAPMTLISEKEGRLGGHEMSGHPIAGTRIVGELEGSGLGRGWLGKLLNRKMYSYG